MIKSHSGSAVPRQKVFSLSDGSIVVQWTDASVQEVLTGRYRDYKPIEFGHAITDGELRRLKDSRVIEDFDHAYIWLFALPERSRYANLNTQQGAARARAYYINTTLPADELDAVQARLEAAEFTPEFCAREHDSLVAILGRNAAPFNSLREAESAQRKLQVQFPQLLENAVVAFAETADELAEQGDHDEEDMIDLDALIASQTDTTVTEGKSALIACKDDAQRQSIAELLATMKIDVVAVKTGQQALNLLEENPVDVFVLDLQLDDMHGWAVLGKVREMEQSRLTHVIALADADAGDQVFALTVAKVDVYLKKPVSIAKLRQSIWSTLRERSAS